MFGATAKSTSNTVPVHISTPTASINRAHIILMTIIKSSRVNDPHQTSHPYVLLISRPAHLRTTSRNLRIEINRHNPLNTKVLSTSLFHHHKSAIIIFPFPLLLPLHPLSPNPIPLSPLPFPAKPPLPLAHPQNQHRQNHRTGAKHTFRT